MNQKLYRVTKLFLDGILQGLTFSEFTNVPFKVNQIYHGIGSAYKIISITEIDE